MNVKLKQIKLNALSGKYLHKNRIWKYNIIKIITSLLTILVPIIFIIALYITKGTECESFINIVSFILSMILVCFSVVYLVFKIDDKIIFHKFGMKNNLFIASEVDNFINERSDDKKLIWFYRYVTEIDNSDNDIFCNISETERQNIYRSALKESEPGNHEIVCPVCNSSPWEFTKGSCQLCGNTPCRKL